MDKIWFILISGKKEGPFSVMELRRDGRVTPDTLVWREGFKDWMMARKVPELKILFEEGESLEDKLKIAKEPQKRVADGIVALEMKDNAPYFFYWILLVIIVILYVLYKLHEFD